MPIQAVQRLSNDVESINRQLHGTAGYNAVLAMVKKGMVRGMEIVGNHSPKLPTRSHTGLEYFVTWIDDASCKVFVISLREKSEVAEHLKSFVARIELETGKRLKVLQTDGGGEYIASKVREFLKSKGIQHELTTPDTPQHNGVAEHMNRTLLDKVRSMLHDASLPETYWYDALVYAAHLHNVTPKRALDGITPEEA
jgi:transposase InsO family protein